MTVKACSCDVGFVCVFLFLRGELSSFPLQCCCNDHVLVLGLHIVLRFCRRWSLISARQGSRRHSCWCNCCSRLEVMDNVGVFHDVLQQCAKLCAEELSEADAPWQRLDTPHRESHRHLLTLVSLMYCADGTGTNSQKAWAFVSDYVHNVAFYASYPAAAAAKANDEPSASTAVMPVSGEPSAPSVLPIAAPANCFGFGEPPAPMAELPGSGEQTPAKKMRTGDDLPADIWAAIMPSNHHSPSPCVPAASPGGTAAFQSPSLGAAASSGVLPPGSASPRGAVYILYWLHSLLLVV